MAQLNPVSRLKAWTIRKYKERYYISSEDHPRTWGKPYKTLRNAITAIARKLEKEYLQREQRYGGVS